MESRHGYTIEEAASELGKTVQWVNEQIETGVIRVSRAKWDRRRKYISEPMMKRLRKNAEEKAEKPEALGKDWLSLSDAAQEAGICTTTLIRWATHEGMARREVRRAAGAITAKPYAPMRADTGECPVPPRDTACVVVAPNPERRRGISTRRRNTSCRLPHGPPYRRAATADAAA